jgi:Na+/H+ antiporter NhaC
MLAIAVPLSQRLDLSQPLVVAAVLGGGIFGDHCSPISDTTVVSSMAAATDHIDHVRTQLPYALCTGLVALVLFVLAGWWTA